MTVQLNGHTHDITPGTSVADLINEIAGSTRGSAVVVDDAVVPRAEWATYALRDGQTVELITAVQGG